MIVSFTIPTLYATFRGAPFSFKWYQSEIVLYVIQALPVIVGLLLRVGVLVKIGILVGVGVLVILGVLK